MCIVLICCYEAIFDMISCFKGENLKSMDWQVGIHINKYFNRISTKKFKNNKYN